MDTKFKYKIINGENDLLTSQIYNSGFEAHYTGQHIRSSDKYYTVYTMPYKNPFDEFYTIELKEIQPPIPNSN